LPRFENGFDKNIEFYPSFETFSIIGNPSSHHIFDRFHITEKLTCISFFPCQIFLEFLREFLVFFYDIDIFLKRSDKCFYLNYYLLIHSARSSETRPFIFFIGKFRFPLIGSSFCTCKPLVHFFGGKPWHIDIHHLSLELQKRKMRHKFECRLDSGYILSERTIGFIGSFSIREFICNIGITREIES